MLKIVKRKNPIARGLMDEQELLEHAKKIVRNRRGIILHAACWAVISAVICIAVPEKAMGVRIGLLVLGFWGICVAIHTVCAFFVWRKLTGKKTAHSYESAVQREYEKLKALQDGEQKE